MFFIPAGRSDILNATKYIQNCYESLYFDKIVDSTIPQVIIINNLRGLQLFNCTFACFTSMLKVHSNTNTNSHCCGDKSHKQQPVKPKVSLDNQLSWQRTTVNRGVLVYY